MTATATAEITDPVLHRFAEEVGAVDPVAIEGNRTRWDLGGAIDASVRTVKAPTGVVDYKPAEMTIQARAGMSVAELNATLAEQGQLSALPDRGGTIGGALAVGESDIRTLGRGRLRTSLLQVRYVTFDGKLVTGGGPTVKNVSGFDIPRLMVGSLGTLGFIGEVIIRTNPIPAVSVLLSSTDADPFAIPDTVLRPTVVLWDGTTSWVELAGHADEVTGERRKLDSIGSFSEASNLPTVPAHRWSLQPADLRKLPGEAYDTGGWIASIGTGLAWADKPQPPRVLSSGVDAIHTRMKSEFDPTGRLNPGRDPRTR